MVAADRKWLSTPSYSWLFDNRLHPRQPYNNLLASLKDGIESSSGGLWPSVGGLAKTLRREKPEWWASVDWEMLDNGRLRLDTALKRWRQCRTGKHDWHKPGTCGFHQFHKRGDR